MSPEPKPYEPEVPQTEGLNTPAGPRELKPVSLFHVGAKQRHDIEMVIGEPARDVTFITTDPEGEPVPATQQAPTPTKAQKGRRPGEPPRD